MREELLQRLEPIDRVEYRLKIASVERTTNFVQLLFFGLAGVSLLFAWQFGAIALYAFAVAVIIILLSFIIECVVKNGVEREYTLKFLQRQDRMRNGRVCL